MAKETQSKPTFFQQYRWGLLTLAVAVVVAGAAAYLSLLPPAATTPTTRALTESERVLRKARDLRAVNQPSVAVDLLKQYIETHPKDIDVRLALAELQYHPDDPSVCEATLAEALAIAPNNANALWMQGMLANQRGEDPEPFFHRAVASPSASGNILGRFGVYLLEKQQVKKAKGFLAKALEAGTKNGLVYGALGEIALQENRLEEAHRLLLKATQLPPENVKNWVLLSEAQKNLDQPKQAIESLQRALEIADGSQRGMVLVELGRAEMVQRNWQAAGKAFAQATHYPVVRLGATFKAAQCFYFTKKYGLAMQYIDQAYALVPGDKTIATWKRKIEEARFGPIASPKTNALLETEKPQRK